MQSENAEFLSHVVRKPVFGVPTRSDTNRAVQLQKIARDLKLRIYAQEGLYCAAKTRALISCAVMYSAFVFAYVKRFSHDAAHILSVLENPRRSDCMDVPADLRLCCSQELNPHLKVTSICTGFV